MAGFVLYMVSANSIRYGTITGYVWAVVDKHISMGYASPLSNVRDWAPFMHGVEVEIHVPTEPRLMLPWLLFIRAISQADLSKPHEIAWVLVMLFLFLLISRPELLPTAQGAFEAGSTSLAKTCVGSRDTWRVVLKALAGSALQAQGVHPRQVLARHW